MTATPETYRAIFEHDARGARILEDLAARFGGNPYTRGGLEAQRETDFRAGRAAVVDHILRQIERANQVPQPDAPQLEEE